MPRDSSGNCTLAESAFVPGTTISSAAVNSDFSDIITMLTDSLSRSGQGGMTAVLELDTSGFVYSADPDTGMFRLAANQQTIECGGVSTLVLSATGITVHGNIVPDVIDGGELGTNSLQWSDLFLASGGQINWANSDVTITHSANTLLFQGAATAYIFDSFVNIQTGGLTISAGGLVVSAGAVQFPAASVTVAALQADAFATQAQMEAASSTATFVTPGRAQNHPGATKAWAFVSYSAGTPSVTAGYNVSSITDTNTGTAGINFTTAMSSTTYQGTMTFDSVAAGVDPSFIAMINVSARTAATATVRLLSANGQTDTRPAAFDFNFHAEFHGDQ